MIGRRIGCTFLLVAAACGGDPKTTDGTGSTGSTGTTGTGTSEDPTTSTSTSTSTTASTGEGGSGSGSVSATDDSGSGTGGQGSGEACVAWYEAQYDAYRPLCECDVSEGLYDSVDACLDAAVGPAGCVCDTFDQAPETLGLLECYQEVHKAMAECTEKLAFCADGLPLQTCIDLEAGLVTCGMVPEEVCKPLSMNCGSPGPFGMCAI